MGDSAGGAGRGPAPDPAILREIEAESAQARRRDPYRREANATGGGFTFTPAQIEHQLRACGELLAHYHKAEYHTLNGAAAVHPPAPDQPGSVLQADGTLRCLIELADTAANHFHYLAAWRDTLVEVKNSYLRNEHLTETQWQRLAGG